LTVSIGDGIYRSMPKMNHVLFRILLVSILAALITGTEYVPSAAASNLYIWDGKARVAQIPILMYHYIDTPAKYSDAVIEDLSVTRANFLAQAQWLKAQGYHSITPDQLIAALWHGGKLPTKPVMFTFDDGYADAWYNATPILEQNGYTGTFFVITDFLDQGKAGYLTWPLARKMLSAGMSIQDHTATHDDMRDRSHEWYQAEVVASAADIKKQTGVQPRFFCFPFNGYDDVAVRELKAAGFVAAFTENDTHYEFAANTMHLPRIRIRGAMTLDMFAAEVKADG
jgi:peptidoglycan/xylan/chitin deacetylase (PgdA/CDA1 family)